MIKPKIPKSVLFVCNMNQIRSPMAEFLTKDVFEGKIYAQSAGVYAGDEDSFMQSVMQERGIDATLHEPETLEQLEDSFVDLVVTLTTQAYDGTVDFFKNQPVEIEYWETENPSITLGNREAVLSAYRKTREQLEQKIRERFEER